MAKSSKRKRKPAVHQPTAPTRRRVLSRGAYLIGGAAVLAAVGAFSVNAVQATVAEQDLTRIGNGTPAIVQIHDPQCSLCTALQRETRKALRQIPEDALTYLVANIRSDDGAAFANRHGQPHVTLLLMDGQGHVQQVINGVTESTVLQTQFKRHIARNQTGS